MAFRQEKIDSFLKGAAASFIERRIGISSGAIISVIKAKTSKDLKMTKIFVSIFPEDKEKEILFLLHKNLSGLRDYVKSQSKMKFLPFFEIEIDKSEKSRQKIERILNK